MELLFVLAAAAGGSAWAVHQSVPARIAAEIDVLAREEPAVSDLRRPPLHVHRYASLLEGRSGGRGVAPSFTGPAFAFPEALSWPADVVAIDDERRLAPNFDGWIAGEIEAGRSPVMALVEDGAPVSICFCARRSEVAAEAGLETAAAFRGRGLGARVTAAWAVAIRATGRVPLYSTAWSNTASLAVARTLGLIA